MSRLFVTVISTAVGAGVFSSVVPVAIWPGEAKLTAPLFCSAPNTEPMVVSDTTHDSEGTSTNYTLYCVGERGALTDEGFALPMLVLLAAHILIASAVVLTAGLWARRHPARVEDTRVTSTEGPADAVEY